MNIRYITIERQYGAGGTWIGQRTAELCGIRCYGKEILERVARDQNLSVRDLENYEENVSGSLLYSMFVMSQSQTGDPDLLSGEAKLYVAEARIIRELAKAGPAVFVGHCAAEALKEEPGVLRVYIRADESFKRRRIVEDYGIRPGEVAAACRQFNRRRSNFYNFCTRKKWMDPDNYEIMLDSSTLGLEACARVLAAAMGR